MAVKLWKVYAQQLVKRASNDIWADTIGSNWVKTLVRVLVLALAPLVVGLGWQSLSPHSPHANSILSNAELALPYGLIGSVALLLAYFLWHSLISAPYRLWADELDRSKRLELFNSTLKATKTASDIALKSKAQAEAESADFRRRLNEIRPYLEMLEAEHKLAEFDKACPAIEIPIPPKLSGDLESDRNQWAMFAESVRELTKAPQYDMGMRGLNVLSDKALARIDDAGRTASMAYRKEEDGVEWAGHEPVRTDWLILAARVDQLRIEQESEKNRLATLGTELTRAQKVDEILNLLPKEPEEKSK